jgi:LAO/AO transport system kinase
MDLTQRLLQGDEHALARLISRIEDREPGYEEVLDRVYSQTGKAYRIGITGPPGAGKSTLVDRLTPFLRKADERVGVLASDPTSPFSGGALLGDRVRMHDIAADAGVFIRSLATRGSLGGLARAAAEAAILLDAAGFQTIIFETIGVGQAEIDVLEQADTVVVVITPQSGDAIQALKAGLMEIADIFVVNKSDQGEADRAVRALHVTLEGVALDWTPPILKTSAVQSEGLAELHQALGRHRNYLEESGHWKTRRQERLRRLLQEAVEEQLRIELWDEQGQGLLEERVAKVLRGEIGPYRASRKLASLELKALSSARKKTSPARKLTA